MKTYSLNELLPFGECYYFEDAINCLMEFETDLRDDLDETIFFGGGRQAVDKKGIFVYERNKRPQLSIDKLFKISLN